VVSRPHRTCVACRSVRPGAELVRLHCAPGGPLSVDLGGGSGRGAYVCARRACLEQAVERGEFARSLRETVAPIEAGALERLILEGVCRKVASLLGLARRARKVVSGAGAVESAVKRHAARLVLTAVDASASSVAKVRTLAASSGTSCHAFMGKEELGAAIGAASRACVAVTDTHFAEAVMAFLGKIPKDAKGDGGGRRARG